MEKEKKDKRQKWLTSQPEKRKKTRNRKIWNKINFPELNKVQDFK